MHTTAALLALLSWQACQPSPPAELLPEARYVKLLAEYQLAKAYLQISRDSLGYIQVMDSLAQHYALTPEAFDRSHAWYEQDVDAQLLRYQRAKAF
ncbi:DUF4296 domain-containing protein, partial [Arthrospira platensis SPKY1]|nr:DUF4296 domain-containing protein [Arthrospira platensis SPKY1]